MILIAPHGSVPFGIGNVRDPSMASMAAKPHRQTAARLDAIGGVSGGTQGLSIVETTTFAELTCTLMATNALESPVAFEGVYGSASPSRMA